MAGSPKLETPGRETFDQIVERYEANPVAFIEGIVAGRFAYPIDDDPYCVSCRSWGELTGKPLLIERAKHKPENLRDIPTPHHRFERSTVWIPLSCLTREQLVEQIERLRRKHHDIGLLGLYLKEKFDGGTRPWPQSQGRQ